MTDRTALTRIAKAVAADMASERLSAAAQCSMRALDEEPEHVLDLVDLLANEGRKKRPSDKLIGGYAFLLAHGLEMLRYAIDREDAATMALVDRLRQHLIAAGETGRVTPPVLLLVLHQWRQPDLEDAPPASALRHGRAHAGSMSSTRHPAIQGQAQKRWNKQPLDGRRPRGARLRRDGRP